MSKGTLARFACGVKANKATTTTAGVFLTSDGALLIMDVNSFSLIV